MKTFLVAACLALCSCATPEQMSAWEASHPTHPPRQNMKPRQTSLGVPGQGMDGNLTLCPDGSYVKGDGCTLGPDGKYY